MPRLQYYANENERYAEQKKEDKKPTEIEIQIAVKKLCRHFKMPEIAVEFTSGNRYSHYSVGDRHLRFNMDWSDWHTVAHEMAHYIDYKRERPKKILKLNQAIAVAATGEERAALARKIEKVKKRNWHAKHHTRIMDRVYDYIVAKGWNTATLQAAVNTKVQEQEKRAQAKKTEKQSPEYRLRLRQEQMKRLERKIKLLQTRLKKARRSAAALERSIKKKALFSTDRSKDEPWPGNPKSENFLEKWDNVIKGNEIDIAQK